MPPRRSTSECCWRTGVTSRAPRRRTAARRSAATRTAPSTLGCCWTSVVNSPEQSVPTDSRTREAMRQRRAISGPSSAERGDVAGAEAAFKRASERGEPNAAFNLEMLLTATAGPRSVATTPRGTEAPEPGAHAASTNGAEPHQGPARVPHQQTSRDWRDQAHRRRFTARRAALVLVPSAMAVAAVLAFSSWDMKAPKREVSSASIVAGANQPAATVSTVAPALASPVLLPASPVHKSAPRHRVNHSPRVKPRPRHARPASPRHVAAPPPAYRPSAPTYIASRGSGSVSTGSPHTITQAPSPVVSSRPAPTPAPSPAPTPAPSPAPTPAPSPAPSHPAPAPTPSRSPSSGSGVSSNRPSGSGSGTSSGGGSSSGGSGTASGGG